MSSDHQHKDGFSEDYELLSYFLEDEAGNSEADEPRIRRRENSDNRPLSFAQQRLWVLEQLEPDSAVYNIPVALRLHGKLNREALSASLNQIVGRHEVLRSTFTQNDEGPVQNIAKELHLELPLRDVQGATQAERETEALRMAAAEARRPFSLDRGPLLRAVLYKLSDADHVLLLTVHHIVADGWSMGVFTRELAKLYRAHVSGEKAALPALPIQFADFAEWQRKWLQGEVLERQLAFWKQTLRPPLPQLQLPTDHPRPATQTYNGALQSIMLPDSLTQSLRSLSKEEGSTLFMTLLTGFKALLYRYSGQEDLIVGTPIAGRRRQEVEELIGFFVNTLVLRSDFSGDPSFRDVLARVRSVTLDAYDHQDLPFEKLVEEIQPERDVSRPPLFQVLFVFQNTATLPEFPELQADYVTVHNETAKFDLTLAVEDREEQLTATVEYNTDLFRPDTVTRFLHHFRTLLEQIAAHPDRPISRLQLLTDAERQKILSEWNDTDKAYPTTCLHSLVEEQVERTPNAVAVIFENEQLTYRELNQRANQLAHYLHGKDVRPGDLIGICVERSVEMVVGLLGILKCGAAYVPMDPAYPKERLDFMLADANVKVLLTQQSIMQGLRDSLRDTQHVCLDSDWKSIALKSSENPAPNVTPENVAYVIYTSGSTGQPKGAMNSHRAICNRLFWMQDMYGLSASDRVLQKNPFSFDVSVWEFFWPLITGAGLVVVRPEGHKDSSYLVDTINEHQITTIHFVPSMLKVFLDEPRVQGCNSLKRIICSGEALPFEVQQRCCNLLEAAELHNLYGPTEAAIDVTYWCCDPESGHRIVPIGRPIANTRTYILDKHLQLLPAGVPGELHLGGVQLAYGYHSRPELTAEKFIPDPFSTEPGARLYKTGDLARYLDDGVIEFLGRIDHQVKVRGFRIELGEIEAALHEHPSVQEAVVIARDDLGEDTRLVAYLVIQDAQKPTTDMMRRFLKDKLPEYMVPSQFVWMDSIPLTPNGKADRKSLPRPENLRPELQAEYVAPATELESSIAEIWRTTLGLQRVGVHDNFFDLGGHSLLLVQIHNKLRSILNKKIAVLDLFRYPTIKSLVRYLTQGDEKRKQDTSDEQLNAGKDRLKQLRQRRQQAGQKV